MWAMITSFGCVLTKKKITLFTYFYTYVIIIPSQQNQTLLCNDAGLFKAIVIYSKLLCVYHCQKDVIYVGPQVSHYKTCSFVDLLC